MTLAEYSKYWFENIAPNKLASSTVAREKSDIDRFLLHIGYCLNDFHRPKHFMLGVGWRFGHLGRS